MTVAVAAHFIVGGRWNVATVDRDAVAAWVEAQLQAGADQIRIARGEWQLWATEGGAT